MREIITGFYGNQSDVQFCIALEFPMEAKNTAFIYPASRTTVPFVTAHLEIFHCTHHLVIPKFDLYFTFFSTLNALSKRTSK